jgi:hypothetical protein
MEKAVNRVLLAFKSWEDRKREIEPLFKAGAADAKVLARLQLNHLRQAAHRLRDTMRPDEQPFMLLLNGQVAKLEKQLYTNFFQRIFSKLKDRLFDGPVYLKRQQLQRDTNLEALKMQLREAGLGSFSGKLEHHLSPEQKAVCLPLTCQLGPDKRLNMSLHFNQDAYGNFHLHRLDGSLLEKGQSERAYEFELAEWPDLKAPQALSLLEGRALKQQFTDALGHSNERWVELGRDGVRHYAPGYPFDVATAVAATPNITGNREDLIRCLENGVRISTHWKQDDHVQNIYVQADPANRTLKLFDARLKPVTPEQLNKKVRQQKVQKPEPLSQNVRTNIKNGHKVH